MIPKETTTRAVAGLPALPASLARLAALVRDERATLVDIEHVIRPDVALTANLLRLVNSPYCGLRQEVRTVRQAVSLLGVKRTFEMAAALSLSSVVPARIPGYDVEADQFWAHCVAVAVIAERLSGVLGLDTPDLTFTSALLHDTGKLVIGSYVEKSSTEIAARLRQEGAILVHVEREVLGVDHTQIGEQVARHWKLPDAVRFAARWHHAPGQAPGEVDRTLVDLVHAADALAHMLGFGADMGELSREVERDVVDRLGLATEALERVASESVHEIQGLVAVLASAPAVR